MRVRFLCCPPHGSRVFLAFPPVHADSLVLLSVPDTEVRGTAQLSVVNILGRGLATRACQRVEAAFHSPLKSTRAVNFLVSRWEGSMHGWSFGHTSLFICHPSVYPLLSVWVLVEDVRNGGASCNIVSMDQMSIKSSNPVYVCLAGFVFLLAFHDIFVYSKNMYQLVIKNICLVKIFFNNLLLWTR